MEAGSSIGATLALPQVAAVARLARKLGIPVSRPAVAAGSNQDIDLWVRAVPEGDEISLTLEGWTVRPAASARLATLLGGDSETRPAPEPGEWSADEDLQLTSVSASLAESLGAEAGELIGRPLMRIFRLEENEAGELPLVAALAARHGFAGQPARARNGDPGVTLSLSGEVMFGADGSFAGFSGRAVSSDDGVAQPVPATAGDRPGAQRGAALAARPDHRRRRAHRRPLGRSVAQRLCRLRQRYLVGGPPFAVGHSFDQRGARGRAIAPSTSRRWPPRRRCLVAPTAEARGVRIELEPNQALPANGEERAVIQILVNLLGNAVRHSPTGGTVTLALRQHREHGLGDRLGPGSRHRPGRPAAHLRAVRASQYRRRRDRARAGHFTPPRAVDGWRHQPRKRADHGRPVHAVAAVRLTRRRLGPTSAATCTTGRRRSCRFPRFRPAQPHSQAL